MGAKYEVFSSYRGGQVNQIVETLTNKRRAIALARAVARDNDETWACVRKYPDGDTFDGDWEIVFECGDDE